MRTLFTLMMILAFGGASYAQTRTISNDAVAKGVASFYHDKFEGRPTSTGEIFDNDKFTAASNTLALGTYVKVTNLSNGKSIFVRINDRMHKANPRLIDMSRQAAFELGYINKGITKVEVEIVSKEEGNRQILAQRMVRDSRNEVEEPTQDFRGNQL